MSRPPSVLVVAGEASGDRMAAAIVSALGPERASFFGFGGAAMALAGARLVADFRRTTAMGALEVAARLPSLLAAYARLEAAIARERPRVALLVDYAELNVRLGARLRRAGVRVLFCVAPQVWAWRPGRVERVGRALDRLAVILPFEEGLWRSTGVDAHYVGHPALDASPPPAGAVRARLGLGAAQAVALLPGSRPHEVRATLEVMLGALTLLRSRGRSIDARLLLAPSLDPATRAFALSRAIAAGAHAIAVDAREGIAPLLPAFDAAIATSGTATLECALAAVPPVTIWRGARLTAAIARRWVRTPHVALPNVLLGERRYPELLQEAASAAAVARELTSILDDRTSFANSAAELRGKLMIDDGRTFGARVAALVHPWLGAAA